MIWSLRTRSKSQTGLGAEELLPTKFPFLFLLFFSSFSPYYHYFIFSFPFPLFLFQSSFLFRATLLIVSYVLNPVMFSVAQKSLPNTLFLKIEMVLFCFNRFMYFFYLFSPFYVSYVLSISSSSSFHRQCKLEGGKCFLSMSTCQTLTSRCRYPIVNCSEVLFVENKMNEQAGKCVRIRAGTHLRHQLTFRNHANVMYR